MPDSADQVPEPLYRRVADRLVAYDSRLTPSEADGLLWMIEPVSGWPVNARRGQRWPRQRQTLRGRQS
jgi:hypothetical protein